MKNLPQKPLSRHYWLTAIAVYKLLQAALFLAIGAGALHLLRFHIDPDDLLSAIADRLRFNPEARIVHFLLEKASLVNDPMLRRIEAAAFCYAALSLIEGVGLYLEKFWAEILTLVITASFLPWELFEILRRVTWVRVNLFAVNLAVVFYLFDFIYKRRQEHLLELNGKANT